MRRPASVALTLALMGALAGCTGETQPAAVSQAVPSTPGPSTPETAAPENPLLLHLSTQGVLAALAAGADPNGRRESDSATPLLVALSVPRDSTYFSPATVDALLAAGADPAMDDQSGWTPLHAAATHHDPTVVTQLLDGGATPGVWGTRDVYGIGLVQASVRSLQAGDVVTPLHLAAGRTVGTLDERLKVVETLLDAGADPNAEQDDGVGPPLSVVSSPEIARALLRRGADGHGALRMAVGKRRHDAVATLVGEGVDVDGRDDEGSSHLLRAVTSGDSRLAHLLLDLGADPDAPVGTGGETPLQVAVRQEMSDVVAGLLNAGADPNVSNDRGVTPLLQALRSGDRRLTNLLLDAGADPNAATASDGDTPLRIALRDNQRDLAAALLKAGADPNAPDGQGASLLLRSLASGDRDLAVWLIEAGADSSVRADSGDTPLLIAVREHLPRVVAALLDAGADPYARDAEDYTPLHLVARAGHRDLAVLLLEAGADPNATDRIDGNTPLHLVRSGDRKLIATLLQGGADPAAVNAYGDTFRRTGLKLQQEADVAAREAELEQELREREAEAARREEVRLQELRKQREEEARREEARRQERLRLEQEARERERERELRRIREEAEARERESERNLQRTIDEINRKALEICRLRGNCPR